MKPLISRAALAAAAIALGLSGAHATYIATGDLSVSLQVTSSCSVGSSSISFSNMGDPSNTPGAGVVTVKCTTGTPFDIDLGQGTGGSAAYRVLKGAKGGTVKYNLYVDTNYSNVWGSTMTGGKTFAGWQQQRIGTGAGDSIPVYGLIAAGQGNAAPDSYIDTVAVTISY